jgi:hypothetical protein
MCSNRRRDGLLVAERGWNIPHAKVPRENEQARPHETWTVALVAAELYDRPGLVASQVEAW